MRDPEPLRARARDGRRGHGRSSARSASRSLEDGSAAATGSQSGNLLARIAGPEGARTILLCAHLDTVPLAAEVKVVREGGVFRNANEAILGADNKAAVAVLLEVARRLVREGSPVGCRAPLHHLRGGGAERAPRRWTGRALRSEFGFVFDHASPIGELIVAAPTYNLLEARFHGAAAHAGIQARGRAATPSRRPRRRSRASRRAGSTRAPPPTSA